MVAGMRLRPKYEFPTLQLIDIYEVAFVGLFPIADLFRITAWAQRIFNAIAYGFN